MAKKYYWLRLQKDFFKRHDIRIIEAMDNGKDYILFYLKLLVESVSHKGELRFSETIPYSEQMLATITNTNIDIVRSAMKVFTELQMIDVLEDQTIFMAEVDKMIGSSSEDDPEARENHRLRQQRYRDRKKMEALALRDDNVTVIRDVEKEIEIEKEKDINKSAKAPLFDDPDLESAFNDFRAMRKKIKAPLTDRAEELAVKKLMDLSKGDKAKAIEILNRSIMNSWKGLFPLDDQKKAPAKENKFNQMIHTDYDFEDLERQVLANGTHQC